MHGGGDETRNAQSFRTLSSLVHESDSDSRDSFWLSSSRILLPTTIPLSPPMSERPRPRQAARREGTRSANSSVAIARWGDMRRSQIGTRACARVDTTPCCVSLRHIKMPINASRAECGPESPSLPRQEASQQTRNRATHAFLLSTEILGGFHLSIGLCTTHYVSALSIKR